MYSHVVLGGTFDHFHLGHEDLLRLAFKIGQKVSLGLTMPSMNHRKQLASKIQPYRLRERGIIQFAKKLGRENDLKILPIKDIYGTTREDTSLQAIIVTPHTLQGAQRINESRRTKKLPDLLIEICPLRHDEDGEVLCSTNIRKGLVNANGNSYKRLLSSDQTISPVAKEILHRPFGVATGAVALRKIHEPILIIGDVATQYCVQHDVPFRCAYIDGQSKRKPITFSVPSTYVQKDMQFENPAGRLKAEICHQILQDSLQSDRTIWKIDGEEDLLTVAAVLLLPLFTHVVYGYPFHPESMRAIRITPRIKETFRSALLL